MYASKLIMNLIVTLGAAVAGAALAADGAAGDPPGRGEAPPLSRAEVIADLQVWRESGMAALHGGDEPAVFNARYQAAAARYADLRASPAFAALVLRIARERGENVQIAGMK